MEKFIETYRMKPRIMYFMFRLWGVSKETAYRSINILWDDCENLIEYEKKLIVRNTWKGLEDGTHV